ncbi:hypothetical protein EST38_g10311 [Candolleomyces aberdarensis]|uniref:Uncharacterized protein n=1 Tax=Candolleomyces aberdarensis TaxID=2316362 RepID=A0A4Q2D8D8_9AGAR|nr:hypothetical protein EST38_g10311 [Candolleomyces aberdarensis]
MRSGIGNTSGSSPGEGDSKPLIDQVVRSEINDPSKPLAVVSPRDVCVVKSAHLAEVDVNDSFKEGEDLNRELEIRSKFEKVYPPGPSRVSEGSEEDDLAQSMNKYLALENTPIESQPDVVPGRALEHKDTSIVIDERSMLLSSDLGYVALALTYITSKWPET